MSGPVPSPSIKAIIGLPGTFSFPFSTVIFSPPEGILILLNLLIIYLPFYKFVFDSAVIFPNLN